MKHTLIWILLLLCPAIVSPSQVYVEKEKFLANEKKPADLPLLFADAQSLADGVGTDFFRRITFNQMTELINYVIEKQWLNDLATRLSPDDMEDLLARQDEDLIRHSIPLFEQAPISKLEKLSVEALTILWDHTHAYGQGGLINWNLLRDFNQDRQKYYLPLVPPPMRIHFDGKVLLEFFKLGRCDLFTTDILTLGIDYLTPYFTSSCLAKLQVEHPIMLNEIILKDLSPNALAQFPSNALAEATYNHLTAQQLLEHVLNSPPSSTQIKYIRPNVLERVLKLIMGNASLINKFPPLLLERLPDWTMSWFGMKFWADANERLIWVLTPHQLVNLPHDAFAAVSPLVLDKLVISGATEFASMELRSHSHLGEVLANLGIKNRDDGRNACEQPRALLAFAHHRLLSRLRPDCVALMEALTMQVFTSAIQLNALSQAVVSRMNALQIRSIPPSAFTDTAQPFMSRLSQAALHQYSPDNELKSIGCAGLGVQQVSSLQSASVWHSLIYECFQVLRPKTILAIPDRAFKSIPNQVFALLTRANDETYTNVIAKIMTDKMTDHQIKALGRFVPIEDHPCLGLVIEWPDSPLAGKSEIKLSAIYRMNSTCFGLLAPVSYSNMIEKSIAKMDDNIFEQFDHSAKQEENNGITMEFMEKNEMGTFGNIAPAALKGIRPIQVQKIPPSALKSTTIEQLRALGTACKYLSPAQIAELSPQVLGEAFNSTLDITFPEDALSKWASDVMPLLEGVGTCEKTRVGPSIEQWRQLGSALPFEQQHPCANLPFNSIHLKEDISMSNQDISKINFWKGMNARCFLSIPFAENFSPRELQLVSEATLVDAPSTKLEQVKNLIPEERARNLVNLQNPSQSSPEAFAKLSSKDLLLFDSNFWLNLNSEVWKEYPVSKVAQLPASALEMMDLEAISKLSNEFLKALTDSQWQVLGTKLQGVGCGAFTETKHATILPLEKLSPSCATNLDPEIIRHMTRHQFDNQPISFWEGAWGTDHIKAIPKSYWIHFSKAPAVGQAWDQQAALHPCYGFADKQVRGALNPDGQKQIQARCQSIWGPSEETTIPWLYIGIAIGAVAILILSLLIYFMVIKPRTQKL